MSLYVRFFVIVLLVVSTIFSSDAQSCADIQVVDLRGVPNFAQTDDLAVCGAADTLAFLIYTDDPGDISGMKMVVHLVNGMEYAGYELTHYGGGTSIANIDASANDPEFLLTGVTGGEIFVAYIAVKAVCDIDLTNDYFVDLDFEYTFTDTLNNTFDCTAQVDVEEKYNNSFSIPVLNILSTTPDEATITTLGVPVCQTIRISQDGLDTYLDSLDFSILGFDNASGITITSLKANDIDLPFTVDGNTVLAPINNTYFIANGSPNPSDNQFNTDEYIEVEVCYNADNCISGQSDFAINYQADYGCGGSMCQSTNKTSVISVRPSGAVTPTATVTLINGPAICGAPGQIDLVVTNPNPNTDQFIINDMVVGFNTCEKSNLNIADVVVAGTSLDPNSFSWVGDEILVDFSVIDIDPDAGTGLIDEDGDGFFDDLLGGDSLEMTIMLSMDCGDGSGSCASVDCGFSQFFVEGKTNCVQDFKVFPPVTGDNIKYSVTADSTNLESDPQNIVGITPMYNFGTYGDSQGAKTRELVYCYNFDAQNVTPCAGGATTYLTIEFSGDSILMDDIEYVLGSVQ